jgi:hypothetical protein
MNKCLDHLKTDKPLRTLELSEAERAAVKEFGLLTAKPILYVANVDESDITGSGPLVQAVRGQATTSGAEVVPVCAKFEAELADLDEADRAEMLAGAGLEEPALAVLAQAAYRTLGLQSYFTAGEKEVRAWTIPVGATAPQAAGVIHSDFEKKFIRWLTDQPASLFGLGIPPAQFEHLAGDERMAEVLRRRLEKLACDFEVKDNYFAWQAFGRGYDRSEGAPLPPYLQRANWEAMKERIDRLEVVRANMVDWIGAREEASMDRFVLLDAQDWMNNAQLDDLWTKITRASRPAQARQPAHAPPLAAILAHVGGPPTQMSSLFCVCDCE